MQNKNKIKLQLLNFEQINSINKSFDILEKGIRRITHKDLLLSIKKKFEKLNTYNTERLKILLFKIFSKNNITRIKILSKYFNRFKYNYYNSQIYNHKNNNLSLKLRNCLNIYNHSLLRKTKLKYFFFFGDMNQKIKLKMRLKVMIKK